MSSSSRESAGSGARVVAFPSFAPGGLEAPRAGHFGHCEVFTLVRVEEGKATDIVVAGIGRRPLLGFQEAGIAR